MTSQEFWLSFVSNFLATFIAGSIIGSCIMWRINKRESEKEKKNLKIENKIEIEKKAIKYLEIIKTEIEDIYIHIEIFIDSIKKSRTSPYIHINTDYWEILKSSGEIPMIFEPILIQILSIFYSTAIEVNEIDNRLAFARLSKNENDINDLSKLLSDRLQSILNMNSSNNIILSIDQSISNAINKITQLEKNK